MDFTIAQVDPEKERLRELAASYKARVEVLEAELETYRERDKQAVDKIDVTHKIVFGLTPRESRILACLLGKKHVSKEILYDFVYPLDLDGPALKIVDVYVCKLRAKLKKYGIGVKTDWGVGYWMTEDDKAKANQLSVELQASML